MSIKPVADMLKYKIGGTKYISERIPKTLEPDFSAQELIDFIYDWVDKYNIKIDDVRLFVDDTGKKKIYEGLYIFSASIPKTSTEIKKEIQEIKLAKLKKKKQPTKKLSKNKKALNKFHFMDIEEEDKKND